MNEKRRDNKGRVLKNGESQRKDGRYLYKYVDAFGETQYAYSWKLVATDSVPKGKRDCISLRELEQEIRRDREDGIDTTGKKMTLCQLYAKQNEQRANVKKGTQNQRKQLMRILKEDKLGSRSIDTIKPSDAKEWALRMKEKGYAYQTINNHKRTLKASFYIAIQAFQRITKNRPTPQPIVIDGYTDFLFLNRKGYSKVAIDYSTLFTRLVEKYNKCHDTELPHTTPHTLRHTFCTKLAQRNMNPKDLQYIMGHSSINITMNWYAHASIDSAKTEVKRLIA